MSALTVGSLFAGIGGFDLGLERAGFEIKWQVEIDPFCRAVLAKHWPDVRRYEDVRTVGDELESVDVLCGGFPCQPVSWAGNLSDSKRRQAQSDDRWLWPEFAGLVRQLRPRYVIVENVPGLLTAGMGDVLGELAELGYDAEWQCVPAAAVGAPHRRDRIWVVAYPHSLRVEDASSGRAALRFAECVPSREVWPWVSESPLLRSVDGLSGGLDGTRRRIHALGNAIVPQIAEWIGRRILDAERQTVTR